MAMFPAFLDTCTLYGAYLCDSLLRLAEAGTYRPLWSANRISGKAVPCPAMALHRPPERKERRVWNPARRRH